MANLNKFQIIGRLTQDPDARQTPSGKHVVTLTIAINRDTRDENGNKQQETTYLYVTCYGKIGELAVQYLHRGREVFIEGRLTMRQWQDKQTGQQRSRIDLLAENMQFLGGGVGSTAGQQGGGNYQRQQQGNRQDGGYTQNGGNYQNRQHRNNSAPTPQQQGEEDDDIPF